MVTMSIFKKEPDKKKTGLLGKMFGTRQTKPVLTPEQKQKLVQTTKSTAKQMTRGAGVMGRGLYKGIMHAGENIQASGMFAEFEPPKRSEYLPTSKRYKKQRKVKTPKSRIQVLREAGLL